MNDWKELDKFLEKYDYTYINPWGLMFNRVAPGFMFVDAPWPGLPIDDISLVYLCNEAPAFFDRLQIKDVNQLDQVTPDVLLKLFYAGDVLLVCTTKAGDTLKFHFSNGLLVSNTEESDIVSVVKPKLEKPEDFLAYAQQYFQQLKEEPVRKN